MSMTKAQQARMADAIRRAAENQGIKQADLARASGTSAGNISYVLACKSNMGEEKWRLVCEYVGVDYDAILAEDVHLAAQDVSPEEVKELPPEAVPVPITPPREAGSCRAGGQDRAAAQVRGAAAEPGGVLDRCRADRGAPGGGRPQGRKRVFRLDKEGAGDP